MKNVKAIILVMIMTFSLAAISNSVKAEKGEYGSLKGTITDAYSNEPIPFAAIVLKQNARQITGTTSDFDGKYSIENLRPGKYDVFVTVVGYNEKAIKDLTFAI